MNILTWNIQATKGCDDRFDVSRIAGRIRDFGDLDVICLQEVARHIPDLNGDDQRELIADLFPGYEPVWGTGFSVPDAVGNRIEFGNLTLVEPELLLYSRVHSLPSPVVETWQMPRIMIETVLSAADLQVSLFNTHLAFHSSEESTAQVDCLTRLSDQVMAKSAFPQATGLTGPYRYPRACDAVILCGDFNVDLNSEAFKEHVLEQNWIDCWSVQSRHAGKAKPERQPTVGCFDRVQWPQGPHVRDYFLATENIAYKTVCVEVDVDTDASDHQPVLLEIAL